MKHMNIGEFADYVDNLEFEELEDVSAFIRGYFESYKEIPEENTEEKDDAWLKYVVLASKYCMTFVTYFDMTLEARKVFEQTYEEDVS